MSALAIAPDSEPTFLADLQAARREALGVLRSVLAALIPRSGHKPPESLAHLREARLAAVDVLAIRVANESRVARLSEPGASRLSKLPEPTSTELPEPLPAATQPRIRSETTAHSTPTLSPAPAPRTPANAPTRPQPSLLLRTRAPSPAQSLLSRLGAAP